MDPGVQDLQHNAGDSNEAGSIRASHDSNGVLPATSFDDFSVFFGSGKLVKAVEEESAFFFFTCWVHDVDVDVDVDDGNDDGCR